jgi:murein DD-endopeptidase MepM/ murein hydrolase activator NlpD
MKIDLKKTSFHETVAPAISRALSANTRHRWLIGGIALFATGTIAAIQLDPDMGEGSLTASTLVMTSPHEITQVPLVGGGMRTVDTILPIHSAASGNIDGIPKSAFNWQKIVIRRGDNLASLLQSRKLYSPAVHHALTTSATAYAFNDLHPGRYLRFGVDSEGSLTELSYEIDRNNMLVMAREQDGTYVTHHQKREYASRQSFVSATIEDSLFAAGKRAGLSDRMILELATIFGWDIDFALDLRRGDHFTVVFDQKFWRGEKIEDGDILAAEFVNRGRVYRAIASKDENGTVRYYTPAGNSMQRQFLKTPVQFSRISSRYTNGRYHPILKRWRAHKGVDYAAHTGTPVRATAAGRILERRRKGGYGRTVVIRHGGKYSTLYAHLSRYQRGQRPGSLVKQGEIIGYVGMSGLATGPHLHYEFLVYGRHRNPLTVKLPRSHPVVEQDKAEFLQVAQYWTSALDRLNGRVQLAQTTQ